MKQFLLGSLAVTLSACTMPESGTIRITESSREIRVSRDNPVLQAATYLNYTERTHRAELKELTGVDPVRTEWCAAFVNAVLEESNIASNNDHDYPLTARAFLDWGVKVSAEDIKPGDLVIFPRGNEGWQGHVGFFIKKQIVNNVEFWLILGGNQNNKVSIASYRSSRHLGIRRQNTSI